MARVEYVILFLALAAVTSAAEVRPWAQCGGTSCDGGGCPDGPWQDSPCTEGFKCMRMTAFFWQCKSIATLYGQCGGNGAACKSNDAPCGDKTWAACPEGATCVRQSPFYWQCVTNAEVAAYKNSFKVQSFGAADAASLKAQQGSKQPHAASNSKHAQAPVNLKVIAGPTKPAATQRAEPTAAAAPSKPAQAGTSKAAMPVLPGAEAPPQVTRAAPRLQWPWSRTRSTPKP